MSDERTYDIDMARADSRLNTLLWVREMQKIGWRRPDTNERVDPGEFLDAAIEDATQAVVYLRGG